MHLIEIGDQIGVCWFPTKSARVFALDVDASMPANIVNQPK